MLKFPRGLHGLVLEMDIKQALLIRSFGNYRKYLTSHVVMWESRQWVMSNGQWTLMI